MNLDSCASLILLEIFERTPLGGWLTHLHGTMICGTKCKNERQSTKGDREIKREKTGRKVCVCQQINKGWRK
jgi:hypothetical protein